MSSRRIDLRNIGAEPSGWADPGQVRTYLILKEVMFTAEERVFLKNTKYSDAEGVQLLIEDGEIVAEPIWAFAGSNDDD